MKSFSKMTFGLLAASALLLGGGQQATAQQAYFIQSVSEFRKSNTPKVLDVPGASKAPGVFIQQFTINHQDNQKWVIYATVHDGWYLIMNVNSGLYLTMKNASNGSEITQEVLSNSSRHLWKFNFRGYTDYYGPATWGLTNGYDSSKSMNVANPVAGDGARIKIWTDYPPNNGGVYNQSWIFLPAN